MIKPIRCIISKIPKIKVLIQDFPLYFTSKFLISNIIDIKVKLKSFIRCIPKINYNLLIKIKTTLGVHLNMIPKVGFNMKLIPHSKQKLFIKQDIKIIPTIIFNTIIHYYIKLKPKTKFEFTTYIKTHLLLRSLPLVNKIKFNMRVKPIVAIFYKNYERGDLTWDEIFNNEEINTWQKLLWREIK